MKEKLEQYLLEHSEVPRLMKSNMINYSKQSICGNACYEESNINTYIEENKEEDTFQTILFSYIDKRNLKDSDVYNKVNIDRRLFSKIRSNKYYHPSKETIILLGISLELTEEELEKLLNSASYFLPYNNTFDLIIRFCFKEKIYNLNEINEFLYEHKCNILN